MIRGVLSLLLFATFTFGQTVSKVKDRDGVPVIMISDVKMFRYSDYFKKDIPDFRGDVVNISGERLLRVSVTGVVHKKDGAVVTFNLSSVCDHGIAPCDFAKEFVHHAQYVFGQPSEFYPADIDSVEFRLETAERLKTEDGFHFSGFVAKDEGCFNDYIATKSLTGLTLRKRLAELLEYGCGFVVEKPQAANILAKKTFNLGPRKFPAVQIYLWDEHVRLGLESPPHSPDSGWVLLSDLEPCRVLTTEQIGMREEK